MTSPQVCIVTGASSGIGQASALALLDGGHTVYGAARRAERLDPLREVGGHALTTDITDDAARRRLVAAALSEHGKVDVLVNCAGVGLPGALEDVPLADARRVFEVNLFAVAALTQLVLPSMRDLRRGTIVNISSIAGEAAFPLAGWYYASKHALEGWADTLRQEVARFGVRVVLMIQPGIIRTEFERDNARTLRETSGRGAYRDGAERLARRVEAGSRASEPAVVGTAVRGAVEAAAPRPRYAVGYLARTVLTLHRVLPDSAFDWVATR